MHLDHATQRYLDYAQYQLHRRPATVHKYRQHLGQFQRFMAEHYPDLELEHLTLLHLDEFVTTTSRERDYAPSTTALLITALRGLCHYGMRTQILDQNPALYLCAPQRTQRPTRPLTVAELVRLLQLPLIGDGAPRGYRSNFDYSRRNRLIVRTLLATGLRRAELCALRWVHLDLTGRPPALRVVKGKGGKDRTLPLPSLMVQELARYRADRDAKPQDPVFASAQGKPLKPDAITYMFVRLVSPAMGQRVTPHMLRHTYATLLSNNGADVLHVQKLLGHSKVTSTQVYVHPGMEQLAAAVQHLPLAHLAWQPPLPLEM